MKKLTEKDIQNFQKKIYAFYYENKRIFPFRQNITAYKVVVSEIMLQQTQTYRVIEKFQEWISLFPDFATLAQATDLQALSAWQGLGYNRRCLALKKIAQIVMQEHAGVLPNDPDLLQKLPHIGPNTAGSICAFAFNKPVVFIETNIRTVFTHEFFAHQEQVHDKELLPLIEKTLDTTQPREWYYALMDYGVHLKKELPRINSRSAHYTRQSTFQGSKRQVRGCIIKTLTKYHTAIDRELLIELVTQQLPTTTHDISTIIDTLITEKILKQKEDILFL